MGVPSRRLHAVPDPKPSRRGAHFNKKQREKRDGLWSGASAVVFDPGRDKGFARIPRTVPMIAELINLLAGKPNAGKLFAALWAHDMGLGFVEVGDPGDFLLEAGYACDESRIQRTWRERMQILEDLGFVSTKPRGRRKYGYVLLLDPNKIVVKLHGSRGRDFPGEWFDYFQQRCHEIGVELS